jgi:hypothetical protein
MRAEHVTKGGHDYAFVTGNYNLKTQARLEWLYVAGDESGKRMELPASDAGYGRVIQSIDDLLQKPLAKTAKLTREEIISIVMYSGPAFVLYNAVLRRFPVDIYEVFKAADNLFSTTIFVLVSAINKLSRCANIPTGTLLYRGLGGTLEFPERFTCPDPSCRTPNALGFLEYGFMSTTADKSIAVHYSGVKEGKPKAGILQIRPNSVDRGADISEFSQYRAEREYLFVPYSFVQGEGRQRTEVTEGGGVLTVVPVHVNINLKTETVDELKEKKKRMHLSSARLLADEVKSELERNLQSDDIKQRYQQDQFKTHMSVSYTVETFSRTINDQCDAILKRHSSLSVTDYVDDNVFRSLVTEILNMKSWAREKWNLWLRDTAEYICFVQQYSLLECHRFWLAHLRKCVRNSQPHSIERRLACLEFLQSKGLVRRNACGEFNADGEDVIMVAGGDGWSANDVEALLEAGADVAAADGNGQTSIWNAASCGHAVTLNALLAGGGVADSCINSNQRNVSLGQAGASALWIAACNGHSDCVQILIAANADLDKESSDHQMTPVYMASQNGHLACLQALVNARANLSKCEE